ncbi:MAG: type II toxin-antitoxin system mRNA interferase toxin, RelE/StbE family [Anaerolineaceae bacterium]|nr:type II toxin-antitoxin system mRNA interferase toxin, RelE/StbE family [Anaerolineaceae bacterium]
MTYELLMSARVEKEFRKFPTQVRKSLVNETLKLADNPYMGEQLKGKFRVFRSLHIKLTNVHYRVIYEVAEAQQKIHVHAVGKRENFYIRLERMKLKSVKAA